MKLRGLTVFFPFYNDAGSVAWLLERAHRSASEVAESFEIVVVDDGSRPEEAAALDGAAAAHRGVRVVRHARNGGYGAAIRSGIKASVSEWVFYTDGDGQYDPLDLRLLWRRLLEVPDADIVNGYKGRRSDPLARRVLGEAYRRIARAAFDLPIRDVNCDFRLMRGALARSLLLRCVGGGIGLELVRAAARRGARFAEVEVPHHARRYGRSEFFTVAGVARLGRELVQALRDPRGPK